MRTSLLSLGISVAWLLMALVINDTMAAIGVSAVFLLGFAILGEMGK